MATSAEISPLKQEVSMSAGDTAELTITLTNRSEVAEIFELSPHPLSVSGLDYQLDFSSMTSRTKIVNWFEFPEGKRFTLAPGESKTIPFRIAAPANAPSGGQYAVLTARFSAAASSTSDSLGAIGAISMRLYTQIAGENILAGRILANNIPAIIIGDSLTTTFMVENTGNLDFYTHDTLKVTQFFSNKVLYDDADVAEDSVIFPETTRLLSNTYTGAGILNVTQTVTALDDTSVITRTVFVLPLWTLIAATLFLAAIIIFIVFKFRARHRLS